MSAAEQPQVRIHQNNQGSPEDHARSATPHGIIALVLTGVALLTAPVLLFLPYMGFLPPLIAAAGALIAGIGLRRSKRGAAVVVTGLIVSVVVFALLAGVATMWNVVVADPAIRDYDKLHEVIEHVKRLVFS